MNRLPSPRSSDPARRVSLPAGGKELVLQPLDGVHALRLLDLDFSAPRERLLSQALAAVVHSMSAEELHRLPLCDRHALVRAALLFDGVSRVEVPAVCTDCGLEVELALDLQGIRLPRMRREVVRAGGRTVRLPTPPDLESSADIQDLVKQLGGKSVNAVESAWEAADPLAELEVVSPCPRCGHQVSARHDLAAGWLAGLRVRARALLEEVHTLATRYHWSEREILSLPESRRQVYLDLCSQAEEEPVYAG